MSISRRHFVVIGAGAAAGLTLDRQARAEVIERTTGSAADFAGRPVVIASANGIRGVARAYDMITKQNADTLTDHVMLVGPGARKFALQMGFKEQNLLTEKSRQDWLRWKACLNPNDNWLDNPGEAGGGRGEAGGGKTTAGSAVGYDHPLHVKFTTGTINMNAVNARGDVSSVTTTSGRSWKLPGRVGDSPIIGAGQYCDNTVGAAGSTGRGEANIKVCGAFLIVEFMRQGLTPEQACLRTIERVVAMTETRLLDRNGRPLFDLEFYALAKDGRIGAASAYEGAHFAVADASGARLVPMAFKYPKAERPVMPEISCRPA